MEYVKTLLSPKPQNLSPMPRHTIIPLATMSNRTSYTLTSGASGNCIVICNPRGAFFPTYAISASMAGFNYLATNTAAGDLVYQGATLYPGPFAPQTANMVQQALDSCQISFVNTLPALTSSGSLVRSVFY